MIQVLKVNGDFIPLKAYIHGTLTSKVKKTRSMDCLSGFFMGKNVKRVQNHKEQ